MSFLEDWYNRRIRTAEQKKELQVVSTDSLQYGQQVYHQIKAQELDIAAKIAELRYKVSSWNTDIEQRSLQIEKEREELQQVKARFRLWLEGQQQELELKKEQFYREQSRADRSLDNEFTLKMGELQLRKLEMEQKHFIELARLDLQREAQQSQRLQIETQRTEKMLTDIQSKQALERDYAHTEKMQQMELETKKFERELQLIRLLDAETQQYAHSELRKKMQDRMDSLGDFDVSGSY